MVWDQFSILLAVSVFLLTLYFKNYLRAVHLALKLPGPPALPILGHVFYILDDKKLVEIGSKAGAIWGPIVRLWVSVVPFFLVLEPKFLHPILSTNRTSTKNLFYKLLHNIIGDGLVTNTGDKWKLHRKLIQPYFRIDFLKIHFEKFRKHSEVFGLNLRNESDFNVVRLANEFVSGVLHDTVLGIRQDVNSPYSKGKFFLPGRVTKPWLLLDAFFEKTDQCREEEEQRNNLKKYTKKILQDRRENSDLPLDNLMNIMIGIARGNPEFTDEDIVDEICTFMLAGQDSVGAALSFSLYFLAANPEIQKKVVEELDQIKNEPTFENISQLRYLEQCIKETLRLCPTVPMIARKLTQDLPLGKHILPVGTNILISPFATHRLPHIFPDPLKFDPERFSVENQSKLQPYSYVAFSARPRSCIGYKFALIELKTVLSEVLQKYELFLTPGCEQLNLTYKISLKAKNGIWLRLKERN